MNGTNKGQHWLAQRPYIIAISIAVVLTLWMMSSMLVPASDNAVIEEKKSIPTPKVKVETFYAENINDRVELYGRTEPDRITTVKAEISGKISEVLAKRGSLVKKAQIIARIEINDLDVQLKQSKALLSQREIEYSGARTLNADGYQGKVQVASAFSNLQAVKADIKRLEIQLNHTVIRAPFDGVLNTRYIEVGDFVDRGDNIAMIADLEPLVVRGFVTENNINHLNVGQQTDIRLLNNGTSHGKIRYIASVADEATNTFKIEVEVANENYHLVAGLSSEISIPLQKLPAIKVSPALLALDEQGNIGIKSVDNSVVIFTPIDIIKSESDGIWLTGLGEQADIIVLGQGFVREGDAVEAIFSSPNKSAMLIDAKDSLTSNSEK